MTFMEGAGHISSQKKQVLYCVVARAEIFELKQLIGSVAGSTTITEVAEIVGRHIKAAPDTAPMDT